MIAISKYNKQHPLRVFEAFAGYGSQSLAFKYLKDKHPEFDFKVVGYSEIEPSAIQAYGLLHGRDISNYGDVTRIDWNEVPDFDFISWSSPCQDFSNAGLLQCRTSPRSRGRQRHTLIPYLSGEKNAGSKETEVRDAGERKRSTL